MKSLKITNSIRIAKNIVLLVIVSLFTTASNGQDVGITNIIFPAEDATVYDGSVQNILMTLTNFSSNTMPQGSRVPLNFRVNSDVTQSLNVVFNVDVGPGDSVTFPALNFPFPASLPSGAGQICVSTDLQGDVNTSNDEWCNTVNYSNEDFDVGISNIVYTHLGDTINGGNIPSPSGNDAITLEITNLTSGTTIPAGQFISVGITVGTRRSNYLISPGAPIGPGESYTEVFIDPRTIPGFPTSGSFEFCVGTTVGDDNNTNNQRCVNYVIGSAGIRNPELGDPRYVFVAEGYLHIVPSQIKPNENFSKLVISDMQGRLVSEVDLKNLSDPIKLELTEFVKGVYVASLISDKGSMINRKFIVN